MQSQSRYKALAPRALRSIRPTTCWSYSLARRALHRRRQSTFPPESGPGRRSVLLPDGLIAIFGSPRRSSNISAPVKPHPDRLSSKDVRAWGEFVISLPCAACSRQRYSSLRAPRARVPSAARHRRSPPREARRRCSRTQRAARRKRRSPIGSNRPFHRCRYCR